MGTEHRLCGTTALLAASGAQQVGDRQGSCWERCLASLACQAEKLAATSLPKARKTPNSERKPR